MARPQHGEDDALGQEGAAHGRAEAGEDPLAGPAVVVAYAAIGLLVILVMRMLAELSVARPDTGSFSSYAGRELGPWAGLTIGWLYAYQWCTRWPNAVRCPAS
ncbi:hypothetical protein [Streptomyces sp. CC224E]|uniref:hypothetical protein n=1 Tax=unclassified Streptomyces TaxID=2593676 RepID=UPI003556889D